MGTSLWVFPVPNMKARLCPTWRPHGGFCDLLLTSSPFPPPAPHPKPGVQGSKNLDHLYHEVTQPCCRPQGLPDTVEVKGEGNHQRLWGPHSGPKELEIKPNLC